MPILLRRSAIALLLLSTLASSAQQPAKSSSSVLATWRKNAALAKSRPVNVVVLGDSIACCIGPANYEAVWTNVLRQSLTLRLGDHGSGVIPIGKDTGLATNPQWSLHPHDGKIEGIPFGPNQSGTGAFGGAFRLTGSAQATVLVPVRTPDSVTLYYASGTDSGDGIRVTYDDGATLTVAQQTTPVFAAQTVTIPLGKTPTAALSFSAASPTGAAYVYAIEYTYGHSGVSLHNLAHGYARTEALGADPATQLAFLAKIQGGIQLAIISLGVNDSINHTGVTPDQYRAHMVAIVESLRALSPAVPIVLFDEIPTVGGDKAQTLPQSVIRAEEKRLAEELHLGYVSPGAAFGSSAEAIERGNLAHDNVHPTDLGDRRIATVIDQYLKSATTDRIP